MCFSPCDLIKERKHLQTKCKTKRLASYCSQPPEVSVKISQSQIDSDIMWRDLNADMNRQQPASTNCTKSGRSTWALKHFYTCTLAKKGSVRNIGWQYNSECNVNVVFPLKFIWTIYNHICFEDKPFSNPLHDLSNLCSVIVVSPRFSLYLKL